MQRHLPNVAHIDGIAQPGCARALFSRQMQMHFKRFAYICRMSSLVRRKTIKYNFSASNYKQIMLRYCTNGGGLTYFNSLV